MMKKAGIILLIAMLMFSTTQAEEVTIIETETETETVGSDTTGAFDDPVPMSVTYDFSTEIYSDGTARTINDSDPYSTIELSVTVKDHLDPDYYQKQYGRVYSLTGTEACCVLEVMLKTPVAQDIVLQDAVLFGMCDGKGNMGYGYQLIDSEIDGKVNVLLTYGSAGKFYKRYDYKTEDPYVYLFMTYYTGGQSHTVYFSLASRYTSLAKTLDNDTDEVKKLQGKLIELGYLDDVADGIFGSNTEKAVRAAQKAMGLTETGIADNEFLTRLYGQ